MAFATRIAALSLGFALCLADVAHAQEIVAYKGRCDASAAAALDANHFIVANDERNTLQIYRRGQPNPVGTLDVSKFLGTKPNKESDLEAAATIGNRIYWMSSHALKKSGEFEEARHRFFATDIQPGAVPTVKVVGDKPYVGLVANMIADPALKPILLAASKLPPEAEGGLNIEGLAATPDGKLLIGFRNPITKDGALLVPLDNPNEVIGGAKPKFGAPIWLKGLEGNGIRSIERVGSRYFVVAGPRGDKGTFALHRWSGKPEEPAVKIAGIDFKDLRPEAMFAISDDTLQIISDDGSIYVGGKECKYLDEAKQSFRSIIVKP